MWTQRTLRVVVRGKEVHPLARHLHERTDLETVAKT